MLYVLLPPSALPFLQFLGTFLVAILLGMASHVPGGLGVFEGLMVLLLKPYLTSGRAAAGARRLSRRLLPAAAVARAGRPGRRRSLAAPRACGARRRGRSAASTERADAARRWPSFTFLAGARAAVLGRDAGGRRAGSALLDRVLPLGVIEASHFLGSVAGAALLILSQGLARRLDAAFYLTAVAIVVGMAASLLKGFDYEEAGLLLLVLLDPAARAAGVRSPRGVLRDPVLGRAGSPRSPARSARRSGSASSRSSTSTTRTSCGGSSSSRATRRASCAPRSAPPSCSLLVRRRAPDRHAPHEAPPPTDADLDDAATRDRRAASTFPFLVYLRDKALLFNDDRTAFVMYGVQGRTWVALGDPVGPEDQFGA